MYEPKVDPALISDEEIKALLNDERVNAAERMREAILAVVKRSWQQYELPREAL